MFAQGTSNRRQARRAAAGFNNRADADGRLSANNFNQNPTLGVGNDNGAQNLYWGVAPVMANYLQTTTYFQNGTSATTGLPGQPALMYDQSQVAGNSYNSVTMPTGQYFGYVSQTPLPDNYGQTTTTPITTLQVENQQGMQFLAGTATVLATVLTDTEEAAPDLLSAEDTTYLYQKLAAGGEHLKFGITDNPATRYTAAELNGGSLNIIAQGQRSDMLSLERNLHSTLPIGPEEGQLFYIQQQTAKGLIPPPYP
jgi:hypothetical protein